MALLQVNNSGTPESYGNLDCENSKLYEEVLCGKPLPGVQTDRGCSGSKIMGEFLNYCCFLHPKSQIKVITQKKEQTFKERSGTMVP